jgi:hypothetical protein
VAACFLAAALTPPPVAARVRDRLDWRRAPNALNLRLRAAVLAPDRARFRWRVDGAPGGVFCRLDVDGDGYFERMIDACAQRESLVEHYREGGVFFVTMEAWAPDGRRGRARVRVEVPGAPPKPHPMPPGTGRVEADPGTPAPARRAAVRRDATAG